VAALFVLTLWKSDYCRRSSSSSNPCLLVARYSNDQLTASTALALLAAQCVGVAAGLQVTTPGPIYKISLTIRHKIILSLS